MRFLLLPLTGPYALIIFIRNFLYDIGFLKSYRVKNSIGIGNLSMGGTGKTPLTIYLTEWLLKNHETVYVLSRGYKRTSRGMVQLKESHKSHEVGDEPLMYKKRFKNKIQVIVSKNRLYASHSVIKKNPGAIMLFDDVFQHRKVITEFSIVTTPFNELFVDDLLIPAGRLREPKNNIKRAHCILVSKCPNELSHEEKENIKSRLSNYHKPIFFSSIVYEKFICFGVAVENIKRILLVTGIANNQNLKSHLEKTYEIEEVTYSDHHRYDIEDIKDIHQKFNSFADEQTIILTTEKDMVRMLEFETYLSKNKLPIYFQPISIEMHNEKEFTSLIKNYVGKV